VNTWISSLTSSLLLGSALVGCIDSPSDGPQLAHDEDALIGNGFTIWGWGTTQDPIGINIGPSSDRTCFLAGVAGNLNTGCQPNFCSGPYDMPSTAWVFTPYPALDHYQLVGTGGAYTNNVNQRVWYNNPVSAQATCVYASTHFDVGMVIQSSASARIARIADLSAGNGTVRQCFLKGLEGTDGAWNDQGHNHAWIYKATVTDGLHPTTGWYLNFDVTAGYPAPGGPNPGAPSWAHATCVDFPGGTTITSGSVWDIGGAAQAITSGPGVKACGLTGVQGAFNQNSWTDGALMNFPAQIDGNWSLTVTGSKTANWACAR